ncbi:type II secretion system protein GspL [Methylobacter sp. S3L5C]|uniref:type II secretion system protein GspL n=1 Tax=Methylobacter sp. S3L5C TaxID=2839024 RepID=UPI001FABEFEC|nr:type II secretion system protein GspL [Methylobacter sp. S3L5C]UOA10529.1 type II secretion system protein GspL [Methylobacter sp. S3L5C]
MAEKIIARLINQQDADVQWLIVNDVTSSAVQQGTLQDLAVSAGNTAITLLLPAAEILLLAVDLPVKSNSQIKKALPFALEDLLADDVDTYHLVWHRPSKDTVYVAAINQVKLQNCLSSFKEAGININSVYPETLCLPYQAESCSLVIDRHNAILRNGQWLGGGIDVEVLPTMLDKLLTENPELYGLQVWEVNEPAQWFLDVPITKDHHKLEAVLPFLQAGAVKLGGEFNLLTGVFGRKNTMDWHWQEWLPALGVILLAVLLQIGTLITGYWHQNTELAALETKTLELFKQTFPEIKRIVNINVQADQQVTELKKHSVGQGSQFMQLLYQTGEMLGTNPDFKLQQLDFINNLMQLQLIATDISQIEQLKQQLESKNALSVKVQSAEAGPNGVEAHLEIKQK